MKAANPSSDWISELPCGAECPPTWKVHLRTTTWERSKFLGFLNHNICWVSLLGILALSPISRRAGSYTDRFSLIRSNWLKAKWMEMGGVLLENMSVVLTTQVFTVYCFECQIYETKHDIVQFQEAPFTSCLSEWCSLELFTVYRHIQRPSSVRPFRWQLKSHHVVYPNVSIGNTKPSFIYGIFSVPWLCIYITNFIHSCFAVFSTNWYILQPIVSLVTPVPIVLACNLKVAPHLVSWLILLLSYFSHQKMLSPAHFGFGRYLGIISQLEEFWKLSIGADALLRWTRRKTGSSQGLKPLTVAYSTM